ncbi:class I SAM-dependent methyltransferase [Edaphobacter bradus]|uniref:class I SAM-dependent methyltransferase n=1 Tax=Edaphobacter bradus TaxID=2259016 RepID=UPI0021E0C51F|nr:class I SAM-dependent methyltransferase [Edaphobacter bradus]
MKPRQPNFDRIARPYRALEHLTLGRALERTRLHYLPAVTHATNALVLGDGDGRFLAHLLAANPRLHATAIDTSAAMLRLLRQRCDAAVLDADLRLRPLQCDALAFTPSETYDLIVTHFFLDCLSQSELDSLVSRIAPSLAPRALWLLSDFRIPPGRRAPAARVFVRGLYLAFRILTGLRASRLPDHATPLTRSGLTCIARHHSLGGILTTELWQTPAPSQTA